MCVFPPFSQGPSGLKGGEGPQGPPGPVVSILLSEIQEALGKKWLLSSLYWIFYYV